MMSSRIDRSAPLPLYVQLKEDLIREIRSRGLGPGGRLPSEGEIERHYGVSRTTIRQALNELSIEGVVERIQGKGTFVAVPKITHEPRLTSFTENMRGQGYAPSRKVLVSVVADPPDDVAAQLMLTDGDRRCRFLRRLLLADDDVVGVAETWLPVSVLGREDGVFEPAALERGSLYDLLQGPDVGLVLHRGVEVIRPRVAGPEWAALLQCPEDRPVLVIDRLTYAPDDRPVEATRMAFEGHRYEYRVELFRP